jgi:hypothetical protein
MHKVAIHYPVTGGGGSSDLVVEELLPFKKNYYYDNLIRGGYANMKTS